jgi:hypothetical protein
MKIVTLMLNFPHIYGVTTELNAVILDAFITCTWDELIHFNCFEVTGFQSSLTFPDAAKCIPQPDSQAFLGASPVCSLFVAGALKAVAGPLSGQYY